MDKVVLNYKIINGKMIGERTINVDGEIYVSFNVNEQAFLYWALQYGLNIEIIKPVEAREKYIKMLDEITKKYKG